MKLAFIQILHNENKSLNLRNTLFNNVNILSGTDIEYVIYDTYPGDEILKVARDLQHINKEVLYIKKSFINKKKSFLDACVLSKSDYFLFLETTDLITVEFLEKVNHKNGLQRILLDKKSLRNFAENFPQENFTNQSLLLWLKPKKTFLEKVRLRYFL